MNVHIKVFPIAGLCDQTRRLELALENGSMGELQSLLHKELDLDMSKFETLMFMHNGRALDRRRDVVFDDGDELWLLPLLCGG